MADLVVGLAKSVVEGALTKAQAAIEEEARLRQSAQRNLVFITGEFEMMHSFLKVADEERLKNKVVMTWVRQIRELAYDVEDCIELVIHLDMKNRWWLRIIPSWCMAQVLPLDEAVGEIEQLKARVEDVSTRNARYSLIGDTGSKPVVVQQELPAPDAAVAAATSDMLAEARGATKRQPRLSDLSRLITETQVISVWGAAGDHGTTAIIRKTYNHPDVCQDFPCRSWVKIIHPFSPHQFMRNMMAQFYATSCNQQRADIGRHVLTNMEATQHQDLFDDFQKLFTHKRCLIVLEGLSHMVDWDAIRAFLPEMENGSCIIVSTKQPEIATMCIGPSYQILELKKYSAQHSVCALFKASQAERNRDEKTMGSQKDEDKGKKRMAYEENQIGSFNGKIISPKKEEANKWMKDHPLIGRQQQLTELGNFLAEAGVNSPAVMSVWGIAEVGKSTLVKYLFCDMIVNKAEKYDKHFWVDISHPFNIRDLYLSLLSDIHSDKDPTTECQELLKKHRCLIVIDGIRSTKDWDLMQAALVSKISRSVIIVITTETSIATYCTNKEDLVFNVKALESAAAFDLFKTLVIKQKSAYPLKDQDADVKYLVSKCGGLPKVISSIAELLAKKTEKRMVIVRSLNERFMHHLETDPEYDNLQDLFGWMHLYFRTCPDELKPCIFYLSIFPQDQVIRRRRLIRRWIAEGYSRDSHNESAEENGEKHFSDLLELSIIQQLSSSSSDVNSSSFSVDAVMMVLCQVNGFIREYVVSRRMEENLVFELGDKCALTTQRTGRHLVILEKWKRDRIVFENMDFSRLRSLTVFGGWEPFFISKSMKMLRVLDLENALALKEDDLYKMVKRLRRLKFISLRGHLEINHLPGSLHRLRQLQTLDVRDTSITTLPKKIAKLEKLQYIRAGTNKDLERRPVSSSNGRVDGVTAPVASSNCSRFPGFCRNHHPTVGVEVQTGIGKLTALHTLGVVNLTASGAKCAVKELQQLTQLRKLGVTGINRKNNSRFFSAIKDHVYLESLSIWVDKDNKQGCCCLGKDHNSQDFLDNMILLPCMNLRSLKLYGLKNRLPNWREDQLRKLTKLELEMPTLLEEKDMKFLGRLPHLCILRLKQLGDGELNFCVFVNKFEDDSYKKIKILEIARGSSSGKLHVKFGSWTMRQLELLKVDCSGNMSPPYEFSGLKNLVELKEILLVNGSNASELKQKLDQQLEEHPNKNKKLVVKVEETPVTPPSS